MLSITKKALLSKFILFVFCNFLLCLAPSKAADISPKITICEKTYTNLENSPLINKLKDYYQNTGDFCEMLDLMLKAIKLPRFNIKSFEYEGGFRLSPRILVENGDMYSSVDFSLGIMTYNPDNHSIFIAGTPRHGSLIEFPIPKIIHSYDINDFNIAESPIQPFKKFYTQNDIMSKKLTGINGYFRITGLGKIGKRLIVNYINWYDANGTEADTTIVFEDSTDLANSHILGPYQLAGGAHAAGWITLIPSEWRQLFNGSYFFGNQSGASINSRLSLGPTAFAVYPYTDIFRKKNGAVATTPVLDFPIKNMLHNKANYSMPKDIKKALTNKDLKNNLWTNISGASVGFVVPGTRTYVTIGKSGGHKSGVGYKIRQDNGQLCGGPCPNNHEDIYSYYWLWDMTDLLKVNYDLLAPHDVRPYSFGEFDIPIDIDARVSGGSYDHSSKRLYLSFKSGDTIPKYARPPIILTFKTKL